MNEHRVEMLPAALVYAVAGVSAPVFALVLSVVAFAIALYSLIRLNRLADEVRRQAEVQSGQIADLTDPSLGGGPGDI